MENRCNSHAAEDVLPACQTTLKNLQLKYLDLYLVSNFLSVFNLIDSALAEMLPMKIFDKEVQDLKAGKTCQGIA